MIVASAPTLLAAAAEVARIASALQRSPNGSAVCIRRADGTLVAALPAGELPAGMVVDERL